MGVRARLDTATALMADPLLYIWTVICS